MQQGGSTSFATIAGAIIPAAIIAGAYFAAFLAVRGKYRSQYAPRTFSRIIPEKDRTPSTSSSGAKWFHDYAQLDDKFILRHHSFDAFLFLRFLRLLVAISFVGCCLTWPILFPLNATGGGKAQQLDKLAFSNVAKAKHCWGHLIVAVLFLSFVILIINRERVFLISLKQAYITTKANSARLSSRTVLFLSAPSEALENGHFQRIFGDDVKRTWTVSKLDDLKKLVDKRNKGVYNLESAEVALAQNVTKRQRKETENGHTNAGSLERGDASISDPRNRPTHRSPPLIGQKFDSIDHILDTIPDLNKQISDIREKQSSNKSRRSGAIFVEFKDQISAHRAVQQVQHHSPLALQPRYIGVPPSNVKWSSLTIDSALRISYGYSAVALIIAITIFWSIPVALVVTISNIKYLAGNVKWLSWINKLPSSILGLIQGFLPPFALSLLTSNVPFWFRDIAELSGEPTAQAAENMTQRWYFIFQFLQVFLVTTLSSSATTIVTQIANQPGAIPGLLAQNLPKSSNFYLTYFTLQGLSSSASLLIKYSDTLTYVFFKMLAKTPRQRYDLETKMKGLFYGSQYPKFTNLAVIAIVYSCIAPLVLGFALIGFTLFYLTYRYLFLYTNNAKLEMKGDCHARALQQMLTGVYVSELCLIGLFGFRNAQGPSIFMTIFFILTVLHHVTVNKYIGPLEKYIPLDILWTAAEENGDADLDEGRTSTNDGADSSEPLISSNSAIGRHIQHHAVLIKHASQALNANLPPFLRDPLSSVLEPHFFQSAESLRPYLTSTTTDTDGLELRDSTLTTVPTYTEQQLANAYVDPALTSKAPLVWIPKDKYGVSEELKRRNQERAGLETSDEGAELDENGKLQWDESDLSKAPIFKLPTRF